MRVNRNEPSCGSRFHRLRTQKEQSLEHSSRLPLSLALPQASRGGYRGFLVVRNPKRYKTIPDFVKMTAFVGLSTYYLQELMEGMDMIRGSDAQNQETGASVRINLFGVPEIKTAHGSINELQYKSVNGWKLLTYLTLKKRPVPARVIAADIWPDIELENQTDNTGA